MKILQTSIKDIKPNPSNPRVIKDEKFKKLVQSIKDFPEMLEMRPIVVNDDNIVLGGNMRLKACHEAGLKVIPVIKASELSEEKQREFIIKDNVGFGEWDWQMLQNDWDTDKLDDWGLDIPSDFTVEPEATEDDYEVPDEITTDIVIGDLFEIGEHRLLCGDSTDSDAVARLMNGEKADMVFTDPPYNVSYEGGSKKREMIKNDEVNDFYKFLYDAFVNFTISTKIGSAIYISHSDMEGHNFRKAFLDSGNKLSSVIIWVKDNSTFSMSKDYKWKHEPILYGWNEKGSHKFYGDTKQSSVWEIKRPSRSSEHPTMKPIELVSKALQNSSKSEDLIFDLFLGSGSTMVAAHQLNRKCYGMELDPKYCQVIIDRMLKLDPNLKIKRNGLDYVKQRLNNDAQA